MNKNEITELLLTLWQNCDQAGQDTIINEALSNIPISLQKKFIGQLVKEADEWHDEELKKETILKANMLLGKL